MTKRREDLEFPELGIGMQDIIKASGTKITRGYCNMVNTMASKDAVSIGSGNEPAGAQPRKKIKRLEEQEALNGGWTLQSINIATNEVDMTLYNKRLDRLRKTHVPQFCKLIGPMGDRYVHVDTVLLSASMKNWSKDWIIMSYPRHKMVQPDNQLIGLQEPAIYLMGYQQFIRRFARQLKDTPNDKWPVVFRGFCLEGQSEIKWPIAILQPLNFEELEAVEYLIGDNAIDDRVKLSFQWTPVDQEKLEQTEMVEQPAASPEPVQQKDRTQQEQPAQPLQREQRTGCSTEKLLVWFVGTNHYSFEVLANSKLQHFNSLTEDNWNQLLMATHFQLVKEDIGEMLVTANKYNRMVLTDIKNEERRMIMHRFARRAKAPPGSEAYLIVRFMQVKEQRMILLKGLRSAILLWAPSQQFQVSYSLPQLTKDELQILYVIEKIDPLYREQEMCRLLLATFNRENINVKEKLKEYFPSKPETLPLRCLDCHYILADLPTIQCFFCGAYCHTRCLSSESTSKQQITIGSTEVWCCVECLPCSVCFCPISDPIVCRHCKTRFHRECGKTRDRLSEQTYECEDCLACDMCDKKLKNCKEGAYILVEEKIYCEDCHSITGEYCRVCMKSWKEHNAEWFQCNQCQGWVHKLCDEGLLRTYAKYFSQPQSEYLCPKCRSMKRRGYLKFVIDVLAKFDEYSYFIDPVYDSLIDYLDIIEHPMCFKKMEERCMHGFYDVDSRRHIQDDFNLIVSNALRYNMPKDLPHKSAKIMKLVGDHALDHFDEYMRLDELELIEDKKIHQRMLERQIELFRYIYTHYLEMLLNKGNFKSKVVVRNKASVELPPFLYFKHSEILRKFKTSTIDLVYAREPPTIEHLFSLPKAATESRRMPATRTICFYHNQSDIISVCNICCEAFCCVEKCFLHKVCSSCKVVGCRCCSWGCGCRAGYAPRDLEHPNLRQYHTDILTLTEMYTYCVKCSINNIQTRECKYCSKLCSYAYIQCRRCSKRFHKNCGKKIFIGQFCYECERLPENENKLKEQIKQETRKRLFKMIRVEKYVPHVLKNYLEEGIRMDPHQVRQLILQNYDSIEEHLDSLQCYENSICQIEKSKVKEQKVRLMNETINKHMPELRSPLRLEQSTIGNTQMQFTTIDKQGYNWCRNESQHKIWEKYYQTSDYIEQASGIAQGTPSSKKPLEVADVSFDTFELPQAQADERVQITNFTHKHTMRSLYESTPLIRPKLTTVVEGRNNQTYDYKGNESAARRIQESKEACRNLFLTFYYGIKQYPRSGSTSLIELKEHSITIYKKWEARNGLLIKLWKENGKWMLRLDKQQTELVDYNDLRQKLSRFRAFDTIEQMGAFLGFHIRQTQKCGDTYIKFLQNNPLDSEAFIDRKKKVMDFYDKVQHNHVERKELFFMNKKSQNTASPAKRTVGQPYLTLEELIRQLDDQPITEKASFKLTDPTRQIFIAPSTIHKLGLFSRRNHPKNTVIIEYMGEILGEPIADIRESQFHFGCYMFGVPKRPQEAQKYTEDTVDEYTPHIPAKRDVIDATFRGNQARYLNHSCDPNCASRIEDVNGQPRILIYAIRDIHAFEELTYDYQFKVSADQKIICTCGAKNCQGRLN